MQFTAVFWFCCVSCSGTVGTVSQARRVPLRDRVRLHLPAAGWAGTPYEAAIRSFSLLFRMPGMTVPLMLGIEWLLKNGVLDFWETALPHAVTELFPTELLSAVAAQFGGLVQSSAVAANLRAEGLIDNSQILLAMLVGSALGNPFRALRRNLPSALAIFPVPIALSIVLGMQLSRFLVTLAGIAGVIWIMLNTP